MIKHTLAAIAATTLGASAATTIASTSFEVAEGFPTAVTGGFNVTTADGATWTAGGTGNYAGAWAGQSLTGAQAAVIGNVSTDGQYITVDAAGTEGVGSITFNWQRFTTTTTPLLVQWTTDTLDGGESWTTADTFNISGAPGDGTWANETVAINQTGDVKVRLFLSGATNTGGVSIDDVSVTAVPEPSSAALLGLGGLALILRRRK